MVPVHSPEIMRGRKNGDRFQLYRAIGFEGMDRALCEQGDRGERKVCGVPQFAHCDGKCFRKLLAAVVLGTGERASSASEN